MNLDPEPEPDIDERGVDRAQIRRMLALTAVERLEWLDDMMRAINELRALNGKPPPR